MGLRLIAFERTGAPLLIMNSRREAAIVKVVWYPKMNQKVRLNVVKKDQLCAVALKKKH